MSRLDISVSGLIQAPVETVYAALGDIENLPNRDKPVQKIEFLTEQRYGAGTRFRETRAMGKKQIETELEVTEAVENHSIRFVSDAGGTIWDTVYTCHPEGSPAGSSTRLDIDMEARAYKLLPKLMNRFIIPMVRKGMAKHLEDLRAYCEA